MQSVGTPFDIQNWSQQAQHQMANQMPFNEPTDNIQCFAASEYEPNQKNYYGMDQNVVPSYYGSQNDWFQKPHYQLTVNDSVAKDDGQVEYPEGQLWDFNHEETKEQGQFKISGNNDNNLYEENNGNGCFYENGNREDNIQIWHRIDPVAPETAVRSPEECGIPSIASYKSPIASIDDEIAHYRKLEKNRNYAAKCLKKKKDSLSFNKNKFENYQLLVERSAADNALKETNLHFAAHNILYPILGDNNSNCNGNLNVQSLTQSLQNLQIENNNIQIEIRQEKQNDDVFVAKARKLAKCKQNVRIATYNNAHKNEMAGKLKISKKTIATRLHRAKESRDICDYDLQATVLEYEIKQLERTSGLLNMYWDSLVPHIKSALSYRYDEIRSLAEQNGQMEQFRQLYFALYNHR